MCDYSLELYRQRPAVEEENLTLQRFPSGTNGFVGKSTTTDALDIETACCLLPGATLVISGIDDETCRTLDLKPVEEATFNKLDVTGHAHRDSVTFGNGQQVLLQRLNAGVRAQVTGTAPVRKEPEAIEPTPEAVDAD